MPGIRTYGTPVPAGLWEDDRANCWRVHRDGTMDLVLVAEVDGETDTEEEARSYLDAHQVAEAMDWLARQGRELPELFERVPATMRAQEITAAVRRAA